MMDAAGYMFAHSGAEAAVWIRARLQEICVESDHLHSSGFVGQVKAQKNRRMLTGYCGYAEIR